jgi:outer membrane receptor protein involved in Fe transport
MAKFSSFRSACLPLVSATLISMASPLVLATAAKDSPFDGYDLDSDLTELASLEVIEVIGMTPGEGYGIPRDKVPTRVQSISSAALEAAQAMDTPDLISRHFSGASLNMAQNNPLQPDLQYRGYTASPLLGLPQGIAIYQNGIRINEAFGDTTNWELIPISAVQRVDLIAGSNPAFGLNTLGGALSLEMKDGFSAEGYRLNTSVGSFSRKRASVEAGGNDGTYGYYLNLSHFKEDGWRDNSASEVTNVYTTLSRHTENNQLSLDLQYGDSELRGNGPSPAELIEEDRGAVFTHPDLTENRMTAITLRDVHWLQENSIVSGSVYWRKNRTTTFNGDGTEFEECDFADEEFLVEEFEDIDGDDECNASVDDDIELVEDQFGNHVDGDLNAINNHGRLVQETVGASVQWSLGHSLMGYPSQSVVGLSFRRATSEFESETELAELADDRSTIASGLLVEEEATALDSLTRSSGIYFANTLTLSEKLNATVSGRYSHTRVKLRDRSGERPELDGEHDFERLNASMGLTYALSGNSRFYASLGQTSRTPTPIELACADPEFECRLPNAFLADPPLEQVVVSTAEAGFQGALPGVVNWDLALFHSINKNDIIFQSTGGALANHGYFDNIDRTQRTGLELNLNGELGPVEWFANYSYLKATFDDGFAVNSPNNPQADDDGMTLVSKGDDLPGLPDHSLKLGADYRFGEKAVVGLEMQYNSGIYLRGDEANLLDKTDGYAVFSLFGQYDLNPAVSLTLRVDNLFDKEYETFGLLGEPEEVLGDGYEDPRFFSAGAPRAAWVGIKVNLK